jgi:3-hydroxyacyl-CoA dehydrogenase
MIGRWLCSIGMHWFEPVPGVNALECVRDGCTEVRVLK